MRNKLLIFVIALLCVPMLALTVSAQEDEPIRVGLLVDQSGWLTIYGVEQELGFKLGLLYAAGIDPLEYDSVDDALAEVRVNGRPIEVIVADYGSENPAADADNAAAEARELFESEFVDIIYGTPNSGAAVQVQQYASPGQANIIYFAGPAASPTITGSNFNENTFRVCRNTDQDALAFATIADQFGTDYVILAVDTDFGRGTAAAFTAALEARGINFVQEPIYAPSDETDFTQYLQQALDSGAETMIQIFAGAGSLTLTQQTAELGVLDQMNVVGGTNSNDIVAAAPQVAVGGIAYIVYQYTLPDTEINDWMTERHIALFNDVPDLFTECSFATAQAMYLALEATEGDPFPDAMIPALEGLAFDGPKGEYLIRPSDHQALAPLYVIQYLGTEDVEIAEGLTLALPQYELVAEVSAEDTAPPCNLPEDLADRCEMDMEMGGE